MRLTEITQADVNTQTQRILEETIAIVGRARTEYGNTHMEITEPIVDTVDGAFLVSTLLPVSKAVLAQYKIREIVVEAKRHCQEFEGFVLDKVIETLIATDPILCNLHKTVESEYL